MDFPLKMPSNDDDRRQRRKQGGVVGAAASKTDASAAQGTKRMLGAATRKQRKPFQIVYLQPRIVRSFNFPTLKS
jgi:hypothetical protein